MPPPPFILSEPPLRIEPIPETRLGVTCNSPNDPNRGGPSQPPLNFVDGNGYIVLRGLVDAKDCEVGWGKVMRAWGNGDEKVVGKFFELLFSAGLSEEQTRDPALPRRRQSKGCGAGCGGASFQELPPRPRGNCP